MPYKLSLMDIALREELVKAIKDNKVHEKLNSQIGTLLDDGKNEFSKRDADDKKGKKRYITVDGVKNTNEKIEVDANTDEILDAASKGMFIDKKT